MNHITRPPVRRWIAALICVFGALGTGVALNAAPASAAPGCPDVQVIFARGTVEPAPPVGLTGLAYAEALRSQPVSYTHLTLPTTPYI